MGGPLFCERFAIMFRSVRTRTTLAIGMIVGGLALPWGLAGQTSDIWFGTWKFNPAKSSFNPGPPLFKRLTCQIEGGEDGLKVTYDVVYPRGGVTHLEWTGKDDGKDYPVEGVDYVLTNAFTRVDDRTFDVVVKVDGKAAAMGRIAISPDGRTITTTDKSVTDTKVSTTTVLDRQ
jgi:hypothetical protein